MREKEKISRRHGGGKPEGRYFTTANTENTENTEVARESRLRAENPATGGTPTLLEESALLRCDRCGTVREKERISRRHGAHGGGAHRDRAWVVDPECCIGIDAGVFCVTFMRYENLLDHGGTA